MILRHEGTPSGLRTKELFVYECKGSHPPAGEPEDKRFLGIWSEHPFYYVFFGQEAGPGFFLWLEKQEGWILRERYHMAYDQWQQTSAEWFPIGPFLIGSGWEGPDAPECEDRIIIRLDPGVVFGSGLHGSTRGCLLAIARLLDRTIIHRAVDLGTGTGILAISCAVLGVERVLAIDNRLLAIRTARKNILLSGMDHRVKLLVAESLCALRAPSELLVMNLERPVLDRFLLEPEWLSYRWVILSGFLERQWDKLKAYIPTAFCLHHRVMVDGWVTVTVSRDDPQSE
jgi:ribosomal protein L11 methyltransferase